MHGAPLRERPTGCTFPTEHSPAFLFLAPDLAPPLAAGFLAAALPAPLAFREVPAVADTPLRPVVPPALLPDFLDGFAGDLHHSTTPKCRSLTQVHLRVEWTSLDPLRLLNIARIVSLWGLQIEARAHLLFLPLATSSSASSRGRSPVCNNLPATISQLSTCTNRPRCT